MESREIPSSALPQGNQHTVGRTAALRAGLPTSVSGMMIDRQCASGLMSIATAAKQIIVDQIDAVLAGGVESISLVQTDALRIGPDHELLALHDDACMPMIDTAEVVAKRYGVTRDRQDAFALQSQQRTAAAQAARRFQAEIISVTTRQATRRQTCGRDHMYRWRDGCGRPVRSAVTGEESEQRQGGQPPPPRFIRPGPAPDRR